METTGVRFIDAFASDPLGGTPVAVVSGAGDRSVSERQAIAAELGPAQTVFLSEKRQIDCVGTTDTLPPHAIVAGVTALAEDGLEPGQVEIATDDGSIQVDLESDGAVWVPQGSPTIETVEVDYATVAAALGVEQAALEGARADLPLAVASVGRPVLLTPVTYLSDLGSADPEPDALEKLCEAAGCTEVFAFTFDTLTATSTIHGRRFGPEQPSAVVTGPEVGAAAAYLERFDAFDEEFPEPVHVETGHYRDRPARALARIDEQLHVGGQAVTTLEGSLVVPPADGDDILEV